jgi:hypothetical protein
MESTESTHNTKISDSAYSNSCSNSQSQRSGSSSKSRQSNSSGSSSGYGGKQQNTDRLVFDDDDDDKHENLTAFIFTQRGDSTATEALVKGQKEEEAQERDPGGLERNR